MIIKKLYIVIIGLLGVPAAIANNFSCPSIIKRTNQALKCGESAIVLLPCLMHDSDYFLSITEIGDITDQHRIIVSNKTNRMLKVRALCPQDKRHEQLKFDWLIINPD